MLSLIFALSFGAFSAWCFMRGLRTGKMMCFWSFALYGEVSRKQSPTWFWTYGALNIIIVLMSSVLVLGALARPG